MYSLVLLHLHMLFVYARTYESSKQKQAEDELPLDRIQRNIHLLVLR
jgi:hypothetical protein